MKFDKDLLKQKLNKLIQFLFNPHLLLCFFTAWMITNGWCYVFLGLGAYFNITWMTLVGSVYAGALWLPFTPEKIITLFLAIFFLKLFFPDDKKTLKVLHDDLQILKQKIKNKKDKRKD